MTLALSRRALLGVLIALGVPTEAWAAPADDAAALNAVLAVEHAVIYDLAVAGAQLGIEQRSEIRQRYDEHRVHRDRLEAEITRLGGRPAVTRPAYQLPGPLGGGSTLRTIELVERAAASAYHQAISAVQDRRARTVCVESFVDEARHLALAQRVAGVPATTAADAFVTGG